MESFLGIHSPLNPINSQSNYHVNHHIFTTKSPFLLVRSHDVPWKITAFCSLNPQFLNPHESPVNHHCCCSNSIQITIQITMKSPWNPSYLGPWNPHLGPWNPHLGPWNPHEITIKPGFRPFKKSRKERGHQRLRPSGSSGSDANAKSKGSGRALAKMAWLMVVSRDLANTNGDLIEFTGT